MNQSGGPRQDETRDPATSRSIQDLFDGFSAGDEKATADLLEHLYAELHFIAQQHMRRERVDHTLQPTALVNEAYIRLVGGASVAWKDKTHFLAAAAQTMRRILVDHARKRVAKKRGGGDVKITLIYNIPASALQEQDLLAVHEVLKKLAELSERQARIMDMRFFAGLSVEETAQILGISERTVKSETRMAKAWLKRELN
jgi:RNA polymerase sigma factor (TIGR02999 family)